MNGIYVQKVHIFNKTIKTRCGNLSENYKLLLRNDFKYVSAFLLFSIKFNGIKQDIRSN